MKKLISIILSICFCSVGAYAQWHDGHRGREKYEVGRHCPPAYFISGNEVFFQGRPVKDASVSSFKILRDGYAKDNWNVY